MRLGQLFLVRFPVLQALALMLLPVAALTVGRDMLGNLFVLGPGELFWVTVLGLWCGWAIMMVVTLVYRYGPARFGGPAVGLGPRGRWVRRHRHWLFGFLGAGPTLAVALWATAQGNPSPPWSRLGLSVLLGILVALVLAYLAQLTRQLLVPTTAEHDNLLFPHDDALQRRLHQVELGLGQPVVAWMGRIARWLGPGFVDSKRRAFEPGHLMAVAVSVAILTVYLVLGLVTRPDVGALRGFPALGYLLLMMQLSTLILGALAFLFDRWRAPTLLVVITISIIGYVVTAADTTFEAPLVPASAPTAIPLPDPEQVMSAWRADFGDQRPRLIVVSASGGGITAASWTAQVLAGLEARWGEEVGRRFTRSMGAISAVSGGSVGTLFYLSRFERGVARNRRTLDAIRQGAAASSLRNVAWGMAYPDIWRFLFAPLLLPWPEVNRAWALELGWKQQLDKIEKGLPEPARADGCDRARWASPPAMGSESLKCLARRVADGQTPVPLFNTTTVETGEAMVFAPVALPNRSGRAFSGFDSFARRWPNHDVDLVTATRLSATFPWITPVARGPILADGRSIHLADGGYFDNAGMATLVEWLEVVLTTTPNLADVLVIRIDAAKEDRDRASPSWLATQGRRLLDGGWTAETVGPIRTLMQVRGATQSSRNLRALDLVRARWSAVDPPIRFSVACFLRSDRGLPLSWRLTDRQQDQIAEDWETGTRGASSPAAGLVRAFLDGTTVGGESIGCSSSARGAARQAWFRDTIAR